MGEKLSNQCVSTTLGFCEEQNPGRKTIDAMHNKSSLSLRPQLRGEKRQGGRRIGAFDRHGEQSWRFIDGHDGIVFIEDGEFP
jgi:hypothetical protein